MLKLRIAVPKQSPVSNLAKQGSQIIKNSFKAKMVLAQKIARENVTGGGRAKDRLNVRSGRLRSSITKSVTQSGRLTKGTIGSNVVYARIHEKGGEVKPVSKQYLTIPLSAAKTGAGDTRGKARDFENTFIRRSKSGNPIIFQKKGDSIIPLFLLVTSVKIPKRPYLRPALEKVFPELAKDIKENFIAETKTVGRGAR